MKKIAKSSRFLVIKLELDVNNKSETLFSAFRPSEHVLKTSFISIEYQARCAGKNKVEKSLLNLQFD